MAEFKLRCWDSAVILAVLLKEDGKWQQCMGVLQAAEKGRVKIVVSSLALAEVLMLRGHDQIPRDRLDTVRAFFRHSWITIRQLDRTIAELAQELVWDEGIKPKDAVHVATAIHHNVARLDTFDDDLIKKGGNIKGHSLEIGYPDLPSQTEMELK